MQLSRCDYLTAQQIARVTGWSVSYIYRLAYREQWHRIGRKPVLYYLPHVVRRSA